MKRLEFYVTALLAGVCAGCSNVEDVVSPMEEMEPFVAVLAESESRTALSGNSVLWTNTESEKDALSIFRKNGYNTQYKLSKVDEDNTATFEYTGTYTAPADNFNVTVSKNYAVYPYSSDVAIVGDGEVSVTIPDTQTYTTVTTTGTGDAVVTTPTFDPKAAFMFAASTDQTLNFKNANALLKIELTQMPGDGDYTINSIVLSSDSQMNGKATISLSNDESLTVAFAQVTEASTTTTDNKSLTLNCGEDGVLVENLNDGNPHVFYLVVTPGTYSNLKLTLKGKHNNADYTKELTLSTEEITISRNKIVTAEYICGNEDFTGTITDFESTAGDVN